MFELQIVKTPGISGIEGPQHTDPECGVILLVCVVRVSSLRDSARSDTSLSAEAKGEDASLYNGNGKHRDPWV